MRGVSVDGMSVATCDVVREEVVFAYAAIFSAIFSAILAALGLRLFRIQF